MATSDHTYSASATAEQEFANDSRTIIFNEQTLLYIDCFKWIWSFDGCKKCQLSIAIQYPRIVCDGKSKWKTQIKSIELFMRVIFLVEHTHTHTRKLHHMFVIYIFRTGLQLCTSLFFLKNFSDHWLGKNNLQVLMILSSASVLCNLSIGIRIKEFFNPKIDPHFIWENILFMNIVNLWFSHLQFFWFLITVDKKANQLHWFSLNTNFTSYFPLQSI